MTGKRTLNQGLNDYLPPGCAEPIADWFGRHPVLLRITRSRRSKLGDFRSGTPVSPSVISVNHNLNPYSFLVTLLHEMAHAEVFMTHKPRVQPHGIQWKQAYKQIGQPFLEPGFLPENVRQAFGNYLKNPRASSTSSIPLAETLRTFDPARESTLISELQVDTLFALPDGRVFKRGDKLRKRYRCLCLNNKRLYLFSPLAEIIPVTDQKQST